MSEFSAGIMIRSEHNEIALKHTDNGAFITQLNDAWLCRLSENDFCDMEVKKYSETVLNLSEKVPLMHVINNEDHGFGLGILHNKELIFRFGIIYGFEGQFAFNVGKELYGDSYMEVIMDADVHAKVNTEVQKRQNEIDEKMGAFFTEITEDSVGQFRLFGFDRCECEKIQNTLTLSHYNQDKIGRHMIQELFTILGLSEFCFVSYDYIDPDDEDIDSI